MTPKDTYVLAMNTLLGINGHAKDEKKAHKLMMKASAAYVSDQNLSEEEIMNQAYIHYEKKEFEKAFYLFEIAAEKGNSRALYMLGMILSEYDHTKALEYYQKAYEKGLAIAAYALGFAYEEGLGTEVDYTKAIEYYTFAAENGDIEAMGNLQMMYEDGRGTEPDMEKAAYWAEMIEKAEM